MSHSSAGGAGTGLPRPSHPSARSLWARPARFAVATLGLAIVLSGCLERPLVELNPCLIRVEQKAIATDGVDRVDLLFVIDDSGSMEAEQALLRTQFVRMIELLTTGQRPSGDSFEPVRDLHVGVVSTDLGASDRIPSCPIPGKDGLLSVAPSDDGTLGCQPLGLPQPFLTFTAGDDARAFARDFQCIATLGTEGCGYEQPLEAMLKALMPAPGAASGLSLPDIQFFGAQRALTPGHGAGANAGFLRGLDGSESSILAVVVVTDEEDCSARDPGFFDTFGEARGRQNVLCHEAGEQDKLFAVERYVEGLRSLRPNHPERVIFAAIVGLPDALEATRMATDFTDAGAREQYYDALLSGPPPTVVEGPEGFEVAPVCSGGEGGALDTATPAPRIVQVARGFGPNGVVHSICSDDFRPALDAVVDRIADAIPQVCLSFPLVPDASGRVNDCKVRWELPRLPEPGALASCAERPFLRVPELAADRVTAAGDTVCTVDQVPVLGGARMPGQGWYYDDFTEETRTTCGADRMRRIAFTDPPGPSVKVTLSCTRMGSIGETLDDGSATSAARIGGACAGPSGLPDDALCALRYADGRVDGRLKCHPTDNVCVLPCAQDSDCPAAWVCDTRGTLETAETGPVCVNPTCR